MEEVSKIFAHYEIEMNKLQNTHLHLNYEEREREKKLLQQKQA